MNYFFEEFSLKLLNELQSSLKLNYVFLSLLFMTTGADEIECKPEMILVLNNNDSRPACVTETGAHKLESLGCGMRS
jgi:hypothetical protein